MPEIDEVNGGDLAGLLKANGYNIASEPVNFEMLSALPKSVKDRVKALKTLQVKSISVEAEFYAKVHNLEKEFEQKFSKIFDERRKLVVGDREPTADETKTALIHGASEEEIKEMDAKSQPENDEKGIPDFWLVTLKSADTVGEMIQECDEPVLKHLIDVNSTVELEPPGFTLYFHFSENPYFKNNILKKQYSLKLTPELEEPYDYDGPSVESCTGDKIDWHDGKDITKKVIKKKQKKGANAGKFLTKTVKADSFFNFFDPPTVNEDAQNEEDEDEETHEVLRADYEIGQIIRDHVIPRAVLFYTGEAADMDMFDDFEDGDDEEEEEDDEDEE